MPKQGNFILYQGDALEILPQLAAESVDAIVTDPPYSSGGLHAAARAAPPTQKYLSADRVGAFPEFAGDQMDQLSWALWCKQWLSAAYPLLVPGGLLAVFIDWRQLPALSVAVQWAGYIWQGVCAWDKGNSRPRNGGFRQSAEFVVWAAKGTPRTTGQYGSGVFRVPPVMRHKVHTTEKPVDLMVQLLAPIPKGSLIVDPFAGSGATGLACKQEGYRFIGIEKDLHYFQVARKRLAIDRA